MTLIWLELNPANQFTLQFLSQKAASTNSSSSEFTRLRGWPLVALRWVLLCKGRQFHPKEGMCKWLRRWNAKLMSFRWPTKSESVSIVDPSHGSQHQWLRRLFQHGTHLFHGTRENATSLWGVSARYVHLYLGLLAWFSHCFVCQMHVTCLWYCIF